MKPTIEQVRARLGEAAIDASRSRRIDPRLVAWLRHVCEGQERAWIYVWGAGHTTRLLAGHGCLLVESRGGSYERVKLTALGREVIR